MALVQRLQALYGRLAYDLPDRLGVPMRLVAIGTDSARPMPVVQVTQSQLERWLGAEAVLSHKDTLVVEVPKTYNAQQCQTIAIEGRRAVVLHVDSNDLLVHKVYVDPRRQR